MSKKSFSNRGNWASMNRGARMDVLKRAGYSEAAQEYYSNGGIAKGDVPDDVRLNIRDVIGGKKARSRPKPGYFAIPDFIHRDCERLTGGSNE